MKEEFLKFITERESIRLKRLNGEEFPWTEDNILREYSFTNVKREHDRTTKIFRKIYENEQGKGIDPKYSLMTCSLFRYFGTILFAEGIGFQDFWNRDFIEEYADNLKEEGSAIFTGSYMISNFGLGGSKITVVLDILDGLYERSDEIISEIQENNSWESAHNLLRTIRGYGGSGFMGKELLLDTFFCKDIWKTDPHDLNDWTPIGPGSNRGIQRLLGVYEKNKMIKEELIIGEIKKLYQYILPRWTFDSKLELHDIQFQLCEFDKYQRVKTGEGRPRKKYKLRSGEE